MNREAMDIKPSAVRAALGGDLSGLGTAFWWDETPQGPIYWYERRHGHAPLTAEDRAFLESLLEDDK